MGANAPNTQEGMTMTIKKLLLLASMAFAALAFAAPAAQAESWFSDPGEIELGNEEEATPITVAGELSSTSNGITTGPAVVHGSGALWNDGTGHAKGVITAFKITGELNIKGIPKSCEVTGTAEALPWVITTTSKKVIDIKGLQYTNHYNHACQTFGFPATLTVSGTATGVLSGDAIVFTNAGDLTAAGGLVAITQDGSINVSGPEGETFTLN
jgi:hypothetical protein